MRILVIGAGPTGLTLALSLRAFGVDCDIWDGKSGPQESSKALAINPSSSLQLDMLGLPHEVGARALAVQRLNVTWNRKRLDPVDLRRLPGAPAFLIQPQHATECDLLDALHAAGGKVEWDTMVTGLAAGVQGTQVYARSSANAAFSQTYDVVVGCDGKRSLAREYIGAELEGTDYGMYLALGDFELDWDGTRDRVHYYVYDDTFFVFVPLPDGRWRVVVKFEGEPDGSDHDALIKEAVGRHFERDIFRSGSSWSSSAPLYVRVASKLRAGPVFIAGDAAHLYSPIGGTGMNTGMQDALNLGWKLAYVAHGWAGEELLATYETERLPVIAANAASTDLMTRLIACRPPRPDSHLPFMPRMASRPLLRRQFPLAFSGLALRYGDGAFQPGYATLTNALRKEKAAPPRLRALAFPASPAGRAAGAELASHCAAFGGLDCVVLEQGPLWKTMQAEPDTLQLVRPDGIVSHRGTLPGWREAIGGLPWLTGGRA